MLVWNDIKTIKSDGLYTLKPAATTVQAYRIDLNEGGTYPEYLLIENRQRLAYDVNLFTGGLVIYHVDDFADLQSARGYPGQDGWPGNGNHYQVAVLPKDGLYELERGINDGDAGDMWKPGDILGPGMGGTVFPNTDSYQFGDIRETGIEIEVISQDGYDVTFRIGGFGENTGGEDVAWDEDGYEIPWNVTTGAPSEYAGGDGDGSSSSGGGGGGGGAAAGGGGQDTDESPGLVVPPGFWSLSRAPIPERPQAPPQDEDGYSGIAILSQEFFSDATRQRYALSSSIVSIGTWIWLCFF